MADGAWTASEEGPVAVVAASGNVMLDDLDRELQSQGHRFVRYADDVTV